MQMVDQNEMNLIMALSSIAGINGCLAISPYTASKHAESRIRVNGNGPEAIDNRMMHLLHPHG
jgi:NADP-dependent 3-hydroxy acid dehydrogenase YdfG